jgi:hypothetical protein
MREEFDRKTFKPGPIERLIYTLGIDFFGKVKLFP